MRWPFVRLVDLLSAAAILSAFAAGAGAETATLELKRIDSRSSFSPSDYALRATMPQHFFMQLGLKGPRPGDSSAQFSKRIQKEPKYEAAEPFRGVAKLGSQEFGFALDAVAPKGEAKKEPANEEKEGKKKAEARPAGAKAPPKVVAYNRLYFDLNHNGNLTDDKPIDAEPARGMLPAGYAYCTFPRVDLAIEVDGAKLDYAFTLSANTYGSGDSQFQYVNASLNAAAYREGRITLDGKERRVVLIDFNSNGRFDDRIAVGNAETGDGRVYPQHGDMLLIDPKPGLFSSPYDVTTSDDRYHVTKRVAIDGRFYDLEVSPAGDKLTLTPSTVATGSVVSPHERFRAVLYGDQGVVKITGGKQPAAVPAGEWRLLSYTLDLSAERPKEKPAEPKKEGPKQEAKSGLLQSLSRALLGSAPAAPRVPSLTIVSADGARKAEPIEVREGQTTPLAFGPPYKPVVKVDYRDQKNAQLSLSLVGAAGEVCTNLMVNGGRPSKKPEFTITTAKGEVVDRGTFEYG